MTAHKGVVVDHILVDEQPHTVILVIHQPQHADRTRRDIQKFLHEFRACKGKAGASNLFGKLRRLKLLVARHHEHIKIGFLGIAEKQVLADLNVQPDIHVMAGVNGGGGIVIQPPVRNLELI